MAAETRLKVRLAASDADIRAAQRLRYRIFIEEMGGDGDLVDHDQRLERDAFDPYVDHFLLVDCDRAGPECDHVVGVYRVLPCDRLPQTGGFYCDSEYDLTPLKQSGQRLLELGRSCIDPAYRGGAGMLLLWQALAQYATQRQFDILFGVASFRGTDPQVLAEPLALLHHDYLAPPEMRVTSRQFQPMDLVPPDQLDRRGAVRQLPTLIKAYLRLGGMVGHGAYIDHAFQTTDVCVVLNTCRMSRAARALVDAGSVK